MTWLQIPPHPCFCHCWACRCVESAINLFLICGRALLWLPWPLNLPPGGIYHYIRVFVVSLEQRFIQPQQAATSRHFLRHCRCSVLSSSRRVLAQPLADAEGIRLEVGSGKFDFSLRGASASRVIVDPRQHRWTCTEGATMFRWKLCMPTPLYALLFVHVQFPQFFLLLVTSLHSNVQAL